MPDRECQNFRTWDSHYPCTIKSLLRLLVELEMKSTPTILYNNPHNIQCCFELMCYLLDGILFWIQLLFDSRQIESESRPHCLKRHGWEELNHQNTFPSWVMYLNHHHKWSRNHSWKNRLFVFLIWQLEKDSNLPAARVCLYIKR